MRRLTLIASFGLLAACGHRPPTPITYNVCAPIVAPPEEPLQGWELHPLPGDAIGLLAASGARLVAGLTEADENAILRNLTALKKREDKWQARANILNECLVPPKPTEKPKKRFGFF